MLAPPLCDARIVWLSSAGLSESSEPRSLAPPLKASISSTLISSGMPDRPEVPHASPEVCASLPTSGISCELWGDCDGEMSPCRSRSCLMSTLDSRGRDGAPRGVSPPVARPGGPSRGLSRGLSCAPSTLVGSGSSRGTDTESELEWSSELVRSSSFFPLGEALGCWAGSSLGSGRSMSSSSSSSYSISASSTSTPSSSISKLALLVLSGSSEVLPP
mmetsp:Transcript_34204/g.86169  ORF Transcript_34204/g.86169 Transcript_34204/m.86169 type:complete len:217 (+) Transcript_34204:277-927(+)